VPDIKSGFHPNHRTKKNERIHKVKEAKSTPAAWKRVVQEEVHGCEPQREAREPRQAMKKKKKTWSIALSGVSDTTKSDEKGNGEL